MIDLLWLYGFAYGSALLHEWMHFVFALLFRIPVVSVKIGSDWPQLKIGKWRISPFLGLSYVTTEYEPVAALCFYKKLLYFSSGIGMNALLALLFFFLYCGMTRYIFLLAAISNVVIVVVNTIPVGKTDISTLIKLSIKKDGQ